MDREAWCTAIHEVIKSRTWLRDWTELSWNLPTSFLPLCNWNALCCTKWEPRRYWVHLLCSVCSHSGTWVGLCFPSFMLSGFPEWAQSLQVMTCIKGVVNSLDKEDVHIFSSVSVQWLSRVWLFETPWTAARQASICFTVSWSLLKLMSIVSVMPSSHLILCCPLLLLPPIPSSIRVFSNESTLPIRWPKYWSFSCSIKSFQWIFRVGFL